MQWRRVGDTEVQLHSLLILVLDGGKLSASRPDPLYPFNMRMGGALVEKIKSLTPCRESLNTERKILQKNEKLIQFNTCFGKS
jgi:hypothetical protein